MNKKDGSVIKTIPAKSIVAEMEDLEFIITRPKIKYITGVFMIKYFYGFELTTNNL